MKPWKMARFSVYDSVSSTSIVFVKWSMSRDSAIVDPYLVYPAKRALSATRKYGE